MESLKDAKFRFGEYELDCARRLLLLNGKPLALNPKSYDLLQHLVENHGRVVTKDELLEKVWPGQFVEENNLTVQVSTLRKVFGEKKGLNKFIATVSGKGYSFVAKIERPLGEADLIIERHQISRVVVDDEFFSVPFDTDNAEVENIHKLGERVKPKADSYTVNVGFGSWFRGHPIAAGVSLVIIAAGFVGFWLGGKSVNNRDNPFRDVSIRRLTTNGRVSRTAISPDGKLFAYTSTLSKSAIWLGHLGGGEPIELRPPADITYRSLSFSRDSNSLYYVAFSNEFPDGRLYRLPVFGGVPEMLRENIKANVAFSPDMTRFAFVRNDKEKDTSTLFIGDTDSPSDAVVSVRSLKSQFEGTSPAWSPDGKMIAVSAMTDSAEATKYGVFLVSVNDGGIRQLSAIPFHSIPSLEWMGDGSGLVMLAREHPVKDSQIWHVSYPDGHISKINPDLNSYGSALSTSADGVAILTVQSQILSNIWIAPTDDFSQAKQITSNSIGSRDGWNGLEWMPDGRLIYTALDDKSGALWRMDANGGNKTRLTSEGFLDIDPSATADGQVVVFSSNRSGASEIWRLDIESGELRQLTFGGQNDMPSVSPDGRWAVYISNRNGLATVWRVPLDGGEPVRLANRAAGWVRVSPDSRFIACTFDEGETAKLAIISIDGGEPIKLFDLPPRANFRYGLRWTPDGTTLSYRDWENGYWQQSVAGGPYQRIQGLPEEKLYSYDWSHDGKQMVFARGQVSRDVVLISRVE